ncbi:hypothetical protein, partial [Aneurinibacillus sp. REN35]|uniref:hypothetical protein n=1 Tax=Aneurinibacillus sp. REN35 TaxID=3237286 RepID=UPI0035279E9D
DIFTRTHRVSLFSFQGTYCTFAPHRISAATFISYQTKTLFATTFLFFIFLNPFTAFSSDK